MKAQPQASRIEIEARLALAALRRARRRAERVACETGTLLVEARNGQPVLIEPGSDKASRGSQARR